MNQHIEGTLGPDWPQHEPGDIKTNPVPIYLGEGPGREQVGEGRIEGERLVMSITDEATVAMFKAGVTGEVSIGYDGREGGPTGSVVVPKVPQWLTPEATERLAEKFRRLGESLNGLRVEPGSEAMKAIRALSAKVTEMSDPDPEPTDPRERALWLRQHRNTGPTPKGRRRH